MSQVLEESRPARPRTVDVKKLPNADEAAVAAAQEAALRRKHHEHVTRNGLSWVVLAWFGAIHLGALAAPWYFTWTGLILLIGLHWLTGGIGVCLGYHRMLTHSSFATYPIVRYFIAWIGTLAGEGTCLYWVANHRKHHALSDRVGDPHSPHDGSWWSHILWMIPHVSREDIKDLYDRWVPDIKDDRGLQFLEKTFLLSHFLFGGLVFAIGYLFGGMELAMSVLIWGVFLRLALVLHSTWAVNSASHIWGYRNYETNDDSRNNWWVALITYGEGWHNNHHAYPRMARHGHRWWEIDMTFGAVRLLQALGLAWDVVDNQHKKKT
jgi:stearoyl-CoA desaturase (delta-9 desaturase)